MAAEYEYEIYFMDSTGTTLFKRYYGDGSSFGSRTIQSFITEWQSETSSTYPTGARWSLTQGGTTQADYTLTLDSIVSSYQIVYLFKMSNDTVSSFAIDGTTYDITDTRSGYQTSTQVSTAINNVVPSTGTTGYVLTKTASGTAWQEASGGITIDSTSPQSFSTERVGTQAQYDAITTKSATVKYLIIE